jgi:hypothetical protein
LFARNYGALRFDNGDSLCKRRLLAFGSTDTKFSTVDGGFEGGTHDASSVKATTDSPGNCAAAARSRRLADFMRSFSSESCARKRAFSAAKAAVRAASAPTADSSSSRLLVFITQLYQARAFMR